MTDPAEIRAEGRRLLLSLEAASMVGQRAAIRRDMSFFLIDHADVLLADPAPVGLTEDEALILDEARELAPPDPDYPIPWDRYLLSRLIAIIDRLTGAEP